MFIQLVSLNILFDGWNEKPGFCRDGIVNETAFLGSKPRLLFLMKEVNGKGASFELIPFLDKGGRAQTWDNIARWVFGIRNLDREVAWDALESNKMETLRKEMLQSICVVNLKKSSGGFSTIKSELHDAAKVDKDLIVKQLKLYDADIIIGCGSDVTEEYKMIADLTKPDWRKTSRGIWYLPLKGNRVYISYVHPEARVKDCLLYYGLIDGCKGNP